MARSGNSKAVQNTPEVTFSIEVRPDNCTQLEAGKRLFSRLLVRAQTNNKSQKIDVKNKDGQGRRGRPGGSRRPL